VETNTKICGAQQNIGLVLVFSESKDVEIHEVVEEESMKGPIKIKQSSSPWLTLAFFHDNIKLIF
jgi:hypothetical protein